MNNFILCVQYSFACNYYVYILYGAVEKKYVAKKSCSIGTVQ